jgi:hypothetical protein
MLGSGILEPRFGNGREVLRLDSDRYGHTERLYCSPPLSWSGLTAE